MRRIGVSLVAAILFVPATSLAFVVDVGGPYEVGEGGRVDIQVVVSGAVGEVHYAWDLDGDGLVEDGNDLDHVTVWAAEDQTAVQLVVSDEAPSQQLVNIAIRERDTGPEFQNSHDPRAVVGREWTWSPLAVDHAGDPCAISVEENAMPVGMVYDALARTFRWMPTLASMLHGNPPGVYTFLVTAADADRGRTPYEVTITVVENTPPPPPGAAEPSDLADPVAVDQPTIVLNLVEDADGDPLTYWIRIDSNPCFCSADLMESGPITPGEQSASWTLPRSLVVVPGMEKTYYLQAWTNDGLADSEMGLSLFQVLIPSDGGDGDADADGDGDVDVDVDVDVDSDGDADADDLIDDDDETDGDDTGCSLANASTSASSGTGLFVVTLVIGLLVVRRRRR